MRPDYKHVIHATKPEGLVGSPRKDIQLRGPTKQLAI
jgi:hypothetical protein